MHRDRSALLAPGDDPRTPRQRSFDPNDAGVTRPGVRSQRGELAAQPARGRLRGGDGGQRGAAALAFAVRHGERLMQGLGRLGDVVGVDEQRGGAQRRGGAGLAGEHQRAAALGQHRALLRDQVHAVPDRVHQQDVGDRAGGQRPRVVVLHLEDQRVPVRGAELLGDLPREPPHPVGVGAVLRQGGPGRVGEGQVHDAAPPLRPGREQLAVGGEAADDVLGQLGPVDPDDQLPVGCRRSQRAHVGLHVPGPRALPQGGSVHAERVHAHLGDMAPVGHPPGGARGRHLGAQDLGAALHERGGPPFGVKTGVVRAEDAVEQRPAHLFREQPVVVRRCPGRVAEVRDADVAGRPAQPLPQHPRGQAQVVVLDQDPRAAGRRPAPVLPRRTLPRRPGPRGPGPRGLLGPGRRRMPRCRSGRTPSRAGTPGRTAAGSACRTAGGARTTGPSWPRCCRRGRRCRAGCRASAHRCRPPGGRPRGRPRTAAPRPPGPRR